MADHQNYPTFTTQNFADRRFKRITTGGILTSEMDKETVIIPDDRTGVLYKRLVLYVDKDCHVLRNGDEHIFIPGGTGLVLDEENTPTYSMKFQEDGVRYYGVADY